LQNKRCYWPSEKFCQMQDKIWHSAFLIYPYFLNRGDLVIYIQSCRNERHSQNKFCPSWYEGRKSQDDWVDHCKRKRSNEQKGRMPPNFIFNFPSHAFCLPLNLSWKKRIQKFARDCLVLFRAFLKRFNLAINESKKLGLRLFFYYGFTKVHLFVRACFTLIVINLGFWVSLNVGYPRVLPWRI